MKKVLTFIAALAVLASASFAQVNNKRLNAGETAQMSAAAMFKAMNQKKATPVTTTSTPKNVTSFPWTEDFESGVATGFTFIDADGDNNNWEVYDFGTTANGHNGSDMVAASASYINNVGAVTPDNWMILPAMDIPASGTDFELSWYEKGQDANYAAENYSVYISTTGATVADFGTTAVLSSTTTGDWVKKTVALGSYAGQTIYIAFRHHNVTDMFYLDIDDIRIGGPSAPEVTISGSTVAIMGNPATFVANTSVSNVTWYVDGNEETETGLTLTYTFTSDGTHEVVVEASNTVGSAYDTLEVEVIDCLNNELPYTAVFGETLGCWDTICDTNNGTPGSGWFTCAEMGLDEGQVLSMSAQNFLGFFMMDMPTDNWLFSPEFAMPSTGTYEVAWSVKPFEPSYAGDHYAVYVINGSDTTMLLEETLNSNMTDYVDRMAIIPSTVSGDFKIAFRHFNCEGGYVIILDNIAIRTLTAPQLTINGPAEAENGTAATFTAVCGNAESFTWNIDGNDEVETSNTLTYTFTTDGIHTVTVTATNSEGSDVDSINVEVYTCEAISEFPYSMNFENGLRCWTKVSMDAANDDRFGIVEEAYEGTYGFAFSSYSTAEDYNQYLISPELTLPETDMMIKFMYMGETSGESFRVLASTTDNSIASFTNVLGEVAQTETEWTEIAFLLPAGTKYVAINYYGNYQYYLYIDNISIENLTAPTVTLSSSENYMTNEEVTFTAFAPLATSFSWTVDGSAVSGTGAVLTHTFTTTGSHTVSVTATNTIGSNSTSLTFDVISCDITTFPYTEGFENEIPCWTLTSGFSIIDNPDYASMAHSGSQFLIANYDDYADVDEWAILPPVVMPADASNMVFGYYVRVTEYQGIISSYEIRVSTTGINPSDFNTVIKRSGDATEDYVYEAASLAQFAGQTIRIAIHSTSPMGSDVTFFDDITIGQGTPTGIDNINDINVSIYPNPVSSVLNIEGEGIEQVEVMDLNGRIILTTAASSINIENLASGVYMVRVIATEGTHVEKIVKK